MRSLVVVVAVALAGLTPPRARADDALDEPRRCGHCGRRTSGGGAAGRRRALPDEPRHQPGLLHGYTDDYFKRVEAVEFAVRHDDGANLHTLHQADIVLAGVSRTSKTPLSMYLAQRGYKTGNVPLVPGVDPPRVLLEMDPRKIFGLIIDPAMLKPLRQARVRAIGSRTYTSTYTDADAMKAELEQAKRLCRQRSWKLVDVGGRAVEENATRIIELYEQDPPVAAS